MEEKELEIAIGKKPRILVTSARGALRYVMRHFTDPDSTDFAKKTDKYAAISIQDTFCGGYGFELRENKYCKDVLTLYFDDIEEQTHGLRLITDDQTLAICRFIKEHESDVDTLLIHCFAGVSRSRAVGVFAAEVLGLQPVDKTGYNKYVYDMLHVTWKRLTMKNT